MTLKKLFSAIIIAAFLSCGPNMGTITETDSGIVGKVSYSTGTGAAYARVQLFGARDTSRLAVSSSSTDQNGNYDFHKLTPGAYNVWIESQDSLLALIDSVYVPQDSEVMANATLYKGGSITAIVALQPGHNPTSVFVQALGTQRYSNVDDSGWFTVKGLAQGEYTLRLVSTIPGYTPTYKSIAIASGVNDTLKDTIYMVYSGIPIVTGINAGFDDYTGVAKISWRKVTNRDFYEYKVYREVKGVLNPQPVLIAVSPDSCFIYDTLYRPKVPDSVYDANDTVLDANVNYRYRVTVVNKSMKEGEKYEFADVAGKSPAALATTLTPLQNEKFKDSVGIVCSWSRILTAGKYRIQVSKRADFSSTLVDTITNDTVQSLPGLGLGYYYARVRAMNSVGVWGFWNVTRRFSVIGDLFKTNLNMTSLKTFIQTNDSGYAVIGSGPELIKTDKFGKELWNWKKTSNSGAGLISIVQLDNGNYVAASGRTGSLDCLFMIDNGGNTVWQKTFSSGDSTTGFSSLLNFQDNDVLLLIVKELPNIPESATTHLFKINSIGNVIQDSVLPLNATYVLFSIDKNNFMMVVDDRKTPHTSFLKGEDTLHLFYMDYNYHLINKKSCFVGFYELDYWQLCANGDLLIFTYLVGAHDLRRISTEGNIVWLNPNEGGLVRPTNDSGLIHSYYSTTKPNYVLRRYDGNNKLIWTKNETREYNEIRENTDGTFTAIYSIYTNGAITDAALIKLSATGFCIDD